MRNLIIYAIAACAFLLFNASGCHTKESDTCHRFIHFTNESGRDVYYLIHIFDEIGEYNPALSPAKFKIKNSETTKLAFDTGFSCFESVKEEGRGKIYFFLFDPYVAEHCDWETVQKENRYLKKYVLTIDELNKANWKIVFTGD